MGRIAVENKVNTERRGGSRLEAEVKGWIDAVVTGDKEAFAHIVRAYQGVVYNVCLRMTRRPDAAEDLAQEVFIKAYAGLPEYRGEAKFSTWLYQIAMRRCLDWKRRQASRPRIVALEPDLVQPLAEMGAHEPEIGGLEPANRAGGASASAEAEHLAAERRLALDRLVESLQEPYRSVTRWHYLDGLSCNEIARRSGRPVKTVESQLYRARRMLRERGGALRDW